MIRTSSWIAAAILGVLATPAAAQDNGFEPVTRRHAGESADPATG